MRFIVTPPPASTRPNGASALFRNTGGFGNTATGASALFNNTVGDNNTANGVDALLSNTSGVLNTATGVNALFNNTTGDDNTANGSNALFSNSTGGANTANGRGALYSNTTGGANTANGSSALYSNTGGFNTATGASALLSNTTGNNNTANGFHALIDNTTGSGNIALGFNAGASLTTGSNNIIFGNSGVAGESSTIRIGSVQTKTYIAGIRGVTTGVADAIPVLISSSGQLGTMSCSHRFKKQIKPMDQASEFIHALKPVTFHYKSDSSGTPQFGLIAEEVAEVNPDLVVRDENGEIYTVRYDAVNAMLLNEFLKEHRKVQNQERKNQEQEVVIAQLKKQIETVVAHLKEQDSKIQRVSAQIELSEAVSATALNNP
jgi:Chaperone of endosialidase